MNTRIIINKASIKINKSALYWWTVVIKMDHGKLHVNSSPFRICLDYFVFLCDFESAKENNSVFINIYILAWGRIE